MKTVHSSVVPAARQRSAPHARRLLGALAAVALAGCSLPEAQPDLTRYFVLQPLATGEAAGGPAAETAPRVLLQEVAVPEYLRGKIMAVRVSGTELKYVDDARWAEPLDAGLQRTLTLNLERTGGARVVTRGGGPHDYAVVVRLRECEGLRPANAARLAARIEISGGGLQPQLVVAEEFAAEIPGWNGTDHADLARRLSEGAARLAARIAELLPAK